MAQCDYKKKYQQLRCNYSQLRAYLPRELGEQLRAQLKKDNIAIVDFVKEAARIYLDNAQKTVDYYNGVAQVQILSSGKTPQPESFLPMVHGTATDSLAYLIGSAIEENPLNNTAMLKRGTVELVINSVDEKGKQIRSIGVSTHQLLSIAMVNFTSINHTGSNKDKRIDSKLVHIPLKKFAYLCGYDVIEHTKNTEEEQLKESKRVENNLKNARKQINKDLKILFNSYIHWEEETREKGKKVPKNWDARILQGKGEIRGGFISLKFTDDIAEYLINKPLTQYPVALLKLDTRQDNAYAIGLKMSIQNSMDSNISHGTANTLKVKTLLDVTTLPSIDNATVKRMGWKYRIKEPFETALDTLTACGLLEDWRYSHPKGVEMTDEEATTWGSFEEWADTNIYFILKDAPDHTARIEANLEKKKEKREKAKAYKKKEEKSRLYRCIDLG